MRLGKDSEAAIPWRGTDNFAAGVDAAVQRRRQRRQPTTSGERTGRSCFSRRFPSVQKIQEADASASQCLLQAQQDAIVGRTLRCAGHNNISEAGEGPHSVLGDCCSTARRHGNVNSLALFFSIRFLRLPLLRSRTGRGHVRWNGRPSVCACRGGISSNRICRWYPRFAEEGLSVSSSPTGVSSLRCRMRDCRLQSLTNTPLNPASTRQNRLR